MKKILSLALAVLMLVSALPVAYAAEGEHDYSNGTQITLVGTQETQGASWTVTVPAKMQPGQTGTVTAQGTWAADQFINVHAPKTVTLTYGAQSMDVGITFGKSCGFSKIGSNTEDVTYSADITVAEANRLFGTWEGIIEYEVKLIENGDVNQDGVIDNADSAIIDKHIITDPDRHVDLTDEQKIYADLNGDGDYDSIDSAIINKAVVNICNHDAVNAVQPVETVLLGDADGNGRITASEVTNIVYLLQGSDIVLNLAVFDVNQDGVVNSTDAEAMRLMSLRKEDEAKAIAPNIGTYVPVCDTVPTIEYYPNLVGDVDGNGKINSTDAMQVQMLLAGSMSADEMNLVKCDANGDRIINNTDANMIQQYEVGNSVDGSIVGQYRQDVDNSEYTIEYTEAE